jgi:hypothetical protein
VARQRRRRERRRARGAAAAAAAAPRPARQPHLQNARVFKNVDGLNGHARHFGEEDAPQRVGQRRLDALEVKGQLAAVRRL